MFEQEIHLRDYFQVIRRWIWLILAVFVTVVLAVMIISLRQPPIYQATARILIEKTAPTITPFEESFFVNTWDPEYLATQYKIITSRTLAKKVLQKLGLMDQMLQAQPKPGGFSIGKVLSQLQEFVGIQRAPVAEATKISTKEDQMINSLLGRISISPIRDSRLVDVSVTSTEPEQAALIVNTIVAEYVAQNLETKVSASRDAVRWLIEEVETTRKKVADSEAALQNYKEQEAIISLEDRNNIVMQKLSDLSAAVNNARIKRIALEAQHQQIQHYKASQLATLPQVVNNATIQQLKVELSRLESELSELQKKYRDKHPILTALYSQINAIQDKIQAEITRVSESVAREYEMARAQEQALTKALEEQKQQVMELNQKAITYGILKNDVESNRWIYNTLLQKTKETSISERLETSNVRIVDQAIIPNFPIAPRKKRNVMLAMFVGLILGTSLAFFLEYWDDSIKIPEDLKQYVDMPFLGFIPKVSQKVFPSNGDKYATATIVDAAPRSIVSEAYRSLRTSVTFSAVDDLSLSSAPGSIFLITSSEPSEGKTCTVANLGIAMAKSGRKTLILDCDFRKPLMHRIFDMKNEDGFADMIMDVEMCGKTTIRTRQTGVPNLDLLPCGKIPPNPSELLGSKATKLLIEAFHKHYDTILIDSPPVNTVTDAVILSRMAYGVIVVILAGETKRDVVQRTKDQLHGAGAKIIGGVINRVDMQKSKYYYYYSRYYSHYYQDEYAHPNVVHKQSLN